MSGGECALNVTNQGFFLITRFLHMFCIYFKCASKRLQWFGETFDVRVTSVLIFCDGCCLVKPTLSFRMYNESIYILWSQRCSVGEEPNTERSFNSSCKLKPNTWPKNHSNTWRSFSDKSLIFQPWHIFHHRQIQQAQTELEKKVYVIKFKWSLWSLFSWTQHRCTHRNWRKSHKEG